jgi:hypothetical protein
MAEEIRADSITPRRVAVRFGAVPLGIGLVVALVICFALLPIFTCPACWDHIRMEIPGSVNLIRCEVCNERQTIPLLRRLKWQWEVEKEIRGNPRAITP